jgi:hypothetical protein
VERSSGDASGHINKRQTALLKWISNHEGLLLEPSNAQVFRMGTSPTDQVIPDGKWRVACMSCIRI